MNGNGQMYGHSETDSFDIRTSLLSISDSVRHHWFLVLLTTALTMGLVMLYVYLWPPIYRGQAKLMAERDVDPARDSFYQTWNIFRKDDAQTEIELIKAAPILKEVIEREKLTYNDVYHPFFSHAAYLWQTSYVGKKYRAFKKRLLGEEETGVSAADAELARTLIDMRAGIAIEPVGESNVGDLIVRGPSRRVAQIANTLIDVYQKSRLERHDREAENSYVVLSERVAESQKTLDDVANRRLAFARNHGVSFDFQKEIMEVTKLTELEQDIFTARRQLATLEATLREIDKELEKEPPTKTSVTVFGPNDLRENPKQKRLELEIALIGARNRYREDSPEVKEIKSDIAKLDVLIAEAAEKVEKSRSESLNEVRQSLVMKRTSSRVELEAGRAGLAVMEDTAAKMRERLSPLTSMQTTMTALDIELLSATERHKHLVSRQAQAAVSKAAGVVTPSMRVVEYAFPPGDRSWPKLKILYPSALAVGLLLGVGVALITSYASGRIRREHIVSLQGSAPLYGTIVVKTMGEPLVVVPRNREATISASGPSEN